MKRKKIVVIGGGTGSFNVLSALRDKGFELSAIVTMADHGGSSGILRDELGVLPPGDVRQCLVALAQSRDSLRELFTYRFHKGGLKGHTLGNIFLAACEDLTGSFEKAVLLASDVLRIQGKVYPVTLKRVELCMRLKNGQTLKGEPAITKSTELSSLGISKIFLRPRAAANPRAIEAILRADVIILAPGNLYSSLIPNLLVQGVSDSLLQSRAKKIYICNLMAKYGQTEGLCVHAFTQELERWAGFHFFDTVLYNTKKPSLRLLSRYRREGTFIENDGESCIYAHCGKKGAQYVGMPLITEKIFVPKKGDPLAMQRTLIRHDAKLLSFAILSLL
ncbi:MAG: YvcK family protein [Candidatus Colwellbacteria bacterium]|nr:YvcK family protein [Candidatus Colwellbacteria bacterium]